MNNQIILFDFEYTAWEGSWERRWSQPWEHREIIQIAAIRVALDDGMVETGCFDRLVRPRHNPVLSAYIINLTGIQQAALDTQGVPFGDAFAAFYAFCDRGRVPLLCYGDDPAVLNENFVLNDIAPEAYMLQAYSPPATMPPVNMPPVHTAAATASEVFPSGIYDIRVMFEQAGIDTRQYTSGTVHQAVGAEFEHAAHNALNDVRSLAVTIRQLKRMGQIGAGWMERIMPRGKF